MKPGEGAVDYSQWENEFLTEVDKRLEKYGSAFADLSKGRKEEALSMLQTVKLKEIAAKARGKKRKGLTTKKPLGWKKRPRHRAIVKSRARARCANVRAHAGTASPDRLFLIACACNLRLRGA